MGGWLHTEITVWLQELNAATHLGTNRAQCRLTSSLLRPTHYRSFQMSFNCSILLNLQSVQ